ncbi:MAG: hypothetical protein H7A25_09885 [Leptospiraceae bacterium]|nr:hypothetical protein [Leptospiraceae bacterium]
MNPPSHALVIVRHWLHEDSAKLGRTYQELAASSKSCMAYCKEHSIAYLIHPLDIT